MEDYFSIKVEIGWRRKDSALKQKKKELCFTYENLSDVTISPVCRARLRALLHAIRLEYLHFSLISIFPCKQYLWGLVVDDYDNSCKSGI
jgi:hypothetical protein